MFKQDKHKTRKGLVFKSILFGFLAILLSGISILAFDLFKEYQKQKKLQDTTEALIAHAAIPEDASFHETIDAVRIFVNNNSVHHINEEFYAIWRNGVLVSQTMLDYIEGRRETPVPLECSTRTGMMDRMLTLMGYRTRVINIFDAADDYPGHVFLEVLNPDTKTWEAQDPDYDIYWQHKENRTRVSIVEAIQDFGSYQPCGRQSCGWNHRSHENLKIARVQGYFDYISVIDRTANERYTIYAPQTDLSAFYKKDNMPGPFCFHHAKFCRDGFFPAADFSKEKSL